MEKLKTKKMSLANLEGRLTLEEMEEVMAGSMSYSCGLAIAGSTAATLAFIGATGGFGLGLAIVGKGIAFASIMDSCR